MFPLTGRSKDQRAGAFPRPYSNSSLRQFLLWEFEERDERRSEIKCRSSRLSHAEARTTGRGALLLGAACGCTASPAPGVEPVSGQWAVRAPNAPWALRGWLAHAPPRATQTRPSWAEPSRAEVVAKPFSLYPPAAVFSLTFSWLGRYWVLCRGRGGGGGVQKFRGQWEGPAPLCSEHQDAPGKVSRCGA